MVEGLKYIHRNGFLHRDIKPENIFISEGTPTNIVLGDLGLLSPVGAIGRMAGTNIYKAPEVYHELKQTTAIDIYALG
ncbi:kinase-like domain-containing protein, partial [Usnea florida]